MKASEKPFGDEVVWEALRGCYDPEIPVNIVDLGLVYDLKISGDGKLKNVAVKMTLTAQGCRMGAVIADDAKLELKVFLKLIKLQSRLYGIRFGTLK